MIDPPYPRLDIDLHRKLCETLLEIRLRFPDLRFRPTLSNLSVDPDTSTPVIEDWDLLAVAERYLDRHKDRIPDVGPLVSPTPASTNPDAA